MPGTEFVAVISFARLSGGRAKILEVVFRTGGMKFMIAGRGPGAVFHAPPGLFIASKVLTTSVGISEVTDSHHRTRNFLQELCGGLSTREVAAIRNVAGTDQNHCIL